jgi:hypothetical protein
LGLIDVLIRMRRLFSVIFGYFLLFFSEISFLCIHILIAFHVAVHVLAETAHLEVEIRDGDDHDPREDGEAEDGDLHIFVVRDLRLCYHSYKNEDHGGEHNDDDTLLYFHAFDSCEDFF